MCVWNMCQCMAIWYGVETGSARWCSSPITVYTYIHAYTYMYIYVHMYRYAYIYIYIICACIYLCEWNMYQCMAIWYDIGTGFSRWHSSPVTNKWILSHMNESCQLWLLMIQSLSVCNGLIRLVWIWKIHVLYEWDMSCMKKSCHIRMSHVKYERVISRMNESCDVWMSHVPYEGVMSRMNKSCHMHMTESCQIWMSHVTRNKMYAYI